MKLRTFGRHIVEAFKSIKRNGWMTLAAVSAVAVTLLLVGSFIAILMNINKLATDVEEDVSVRVYIDLAADESEQDELEGNLAELDNVESIDFVSRDDELDTVIGNYGEQFELFSGDDNPLRDVYVVSATEPEQTAQVAEEADEMAHVADVNYGGAQADQLFEVMAQIRNVGSIIIIALIFTAVFLIANTIRITIFSRRTEIEIMKLVGSTNWFIRWPFLIEGALIGLIGSIIPASIISFAYIEGYSYGSGFLQGGYMSLLSPNPFLIYLVALILGIGVLIGSLGSVLSIRKFLKV